MTPKIHGGDLCFGWCQLDNRGRGMGIQTVKSIRRQTAVQFLLLMDWECAIKYWKSVWWCLTALWCFKDDQWLLPHFTCFNIHLEIWAVTGVSLPCKPCRNPPPCFTGVADFIDVICVVSDALFHSLSMWAHGRSESFKITVMQPNSTWSWVKLLSTKKHTMWKYTEEVRWGTSVWLGPLLVHDATLREASQNVYLL